MRPVAALLACSCAVFAAPLTLPRAAWAQPADAQLEAPPEPLPPPESPSTPPPGGPTVELRLEEPGAVLQRTERWQTLHVYWTGKLELCAAPCTVRVPRDMPLRVLGQDFPPSGVFSPPASGDRYLLQVHKGSAGAHNGAGALMVVGGISAAAGAVALVSSGGARTADVVGVALLCLGAVGVGVGLPLLLSSGTTVKFE
jgi:hypothetical protein